MNDFDGFIVNKRKYNDDNNNLFGFVYNTAWSTTHCTHFNG